MEEPGIRSNPVKGTSASGIRTDPSLAGGKLSIGKAVDKDRIFTVPQGISLWSGLFDEGRLCNLGMALEARLAVAADIHTVASAYP